MRTRKIAKSPIADLAKIPPRGESDHGVALDEAELRKLLDGFRDHPLHVIVNVAAFTGGRRSEILALKWENFDPIARTLRIEGSVEHTRRYGLRVKGPKSARGVRTIEIDAGLVTLLLAERDRHLRIVAGVPDGVDVNLSLVKLPPGALMFPALPAPGEQLSLTKLRPPQGVTESFQKRAARNRIFGPTISRLARHARDHVARHGDPGARRRRAGRTRSGSPVTQLRQAHQEG